MALINLKHHDHHYFPPQALQSAFALIGCIALGGLIMIVMVMALDH